MSKQSRRPHRRDRASRTAHRRSPDVRPTVDASGEALILPPELAEEFRAYLDRVRVAFKAQFGREISDDDPLFWDFDGDRLVPADSQGYIDAVSAAMRAEGVDPAYIHAFAKTGLLPTAENEGLLSEDDLAEFIAAYEEYSPDLE